MEINELVKVPAEPIEIGAFYRASDTSYWFSDYDDNKFLLDFKNFSPRRPQSVAQYPQMDFRVYFPILDRFVTFRFDHITIAFVIQPGLAQYSQVLIGSFMCDCPYCKDLVFSRFQDYKNSV